MNFKSLLFIFILSFGFFNIPSMAQDNRIGNKPLGEIIFWGPSPAESENMNEEETEVYSDYYFYIGQAAPELKKMGIELKDTATFELRINYGSDSTEFFQREPGSIAYIFSDGKQQPKIIRYVMLNDEIISAAKEFFGMKDP